MKNSPIVQLQRVRIISTLFFCGLLVGLVSLLFSSCRRKDEEAPVLSISILGETAIQYGENIVFAITAMDNEKLVSLNVLIQSSSGNTLLEAKNYDVQGASDYSVEDLILHNGRYIETGYYLLKAIVSDGENETVAFQEIYLYQLPESVLRYYVLQSEDSGTTRVDSIRLDGTQNFVENLSIDLDVAQCNPFEGTLVTGGREFEGINTWEALDFLLLNNVTTPSSYSPDYFNSMVYDELTFSHYISSKDGLIRNIRGNGTVKQTIQTAPFIPEGMCVSEDYVIAIEHNLTQTENRISVYNRATGTYLQSAVVEFVPKVILKSANDDLNFWVLGNENNTAISKVFSLSNNQVFDPNGILELGEESPILSAIVMPDGRPLVSQENGTYLYDQSFTGNGIYIDASASQLVYEPLNNLVFVLTEGSMKVLEYGTFNLIQTYSLLSGHAMICILYNK
jgi:hypothetical protein